MTTRTDWIQTYTGKKFFPLDPDPDQICIEDIAHSLSMQCRYNGHSKRFYSVAQYSVILSREFFNTADYKLIALLHDASEAYLSDLPAPLKRLPAFAFYRLAEARLQTMIYSKYGLNGDFSVGQIIASYDRANSRELIDIVPWKPETAENEFLNAFTFLTPLVFPNVIKEAE